MKLLYICANVFLIYDILEYVYHSACDKKFSVQSDPYVVQRKYILIVLLIQHVSLQPKTLMW